MGSCLLIFPPVCPLHSHPEVGLGQLAAWLRARRIAVRVLDLNVELLHGHLQSEAGLTELLATFSDAEVRRVQALPGHLARRWTDVVNAIHQEVPRALPRDLLTEHLRRYLEHHEGALAGPPPSDASETPDAGGRSAGELVRRLLTLDPLRWLVTVRLAEMPRVPGRQVAQQLADRPPFDLDAVALVRVGTKRCGNQDLVCHVVQHSIQWPICSWSASNADRSSRSRHDVISRGSPFRTDTMR